ncbi:E3 ubiquitin-protein ligase SINA-like 10 [Lactuca sativa]|nr:E3 ubiquitin-protein ligase SINA-like 10 [Lactuca sativa]XP_052624078.1 E3 ubiquitin-protein ligase SINA-like 10 [Lactuca sativa]XP_052624079.1 E3 ubiquitin-protein ligase SINA-like 10 [Lactuca sativa]XP_052624080.1 E3 ubiquitin-protein ligase SINA-like 10 [Lactuca sativa]XP_052624081.1 E3 ubiquitin-protein ligase SINA-like 10 [Lactuca sativa]XP_052624082.1 E3 ubiquitin-protein ligase SINA-like 10 [Lactuca sativa]XP_052624083.1 E3 ubiquitin-protein ligase SINA-like 10 [Lactuca sativa]
MNQEVDMVPLEVVDSDSDSNSDPQRLEAEDKGADGVPEVAGEAIPIVATDPDLLNCSICHYPLCTPIFLCDDGHTSCYTCLIRSENKCPSCSVPKGFKHCRGMEKLIASLRVECKNKKFGCQEILMNHKRAKHENICPHTLCFCPDSSCGLAASCKLLYNHFSRHHSAIQFVYNAVFNLRVETTQKHVILQERNEKVIFIVNHDVVGHGRVFNVDCVGPDTFKNGFVYRLTVKSMDACLSMECVPEVSTKWKEHTPDNNYLTIPSRITGFGLQVCIKKAQKESWSFKGNGF